MRLDIFLVRLDILRFLSINPIFFFVWRFLRPRICEAASTVEGGDISRRQRTAPRNFSGIDGSILNCGGVICSALVGVSSAPF